jgi:hypothetical protein
VEETNTNWRYEPLETKKFLVLPKNVPIVAIWGKDLVNPPLMGSD